ncbi:PPP family 3-phenylpropionic acid transporter [Pseudomonas duriflava]|uniref:PPP family 3-phenylpropionic acid transporter n=1 Tax=Pseudomonas duriflava TaxID=459528 RepID=A0A562QCE8_9PSED|nr:MFS transporter [Pseudomonas duriflava]TWI53840.1 PPP family 3-phenylpropionic acid transporter [Pseudomonas duriflava]
MTVPYWRLSSFYFCYFALLGATAPFLSLYFHHLGFSSEHIGQLVAIPMLMRCLAPNLWGWLGDRTGRRLAIVRFGACCTLIAFAGIYLSHSYAWLALIMALHAFFWHAVLPQFEAITLAYLQERAALYSRIRLWGSVGFIAAVALLGYVFQWFSLDVYPAALLIIMAGIVISSVWVPAPATVKVDAPAGESGFLARLRQPGGIAFYIGAALMQLSHGPYYTFLTLHLESLGYSRGVIGQLWALGVIAEVLIFLVMPRLLALFSLKQVLAASFLLAVLRWQLLGNLADHLAILLFAQLLHAATFGFFHAAAIHFIQRRFGLRQQGQGQAFYAALSGTGGALGALYSGYSWQALGPAWTFGFASLAALAGAVLIIIRLEDRYHDESP